MFRTLILTIMTLFVTSICGPAQADEIDDLIPAIIEVESGGRANAISPKGAIGLMQITPIVVKKFNEYHYKTMEIPKMADLYLPVTQNDLFIADKNKFIGTWYLRHLKDHYLKDHYTIERLLATYNMGPTRLKKLDYEWWRIKETKNYVKKVLALYKNR